MALIFDKFRSYKKAEVFQRAVQRMYPNQPTHIWLDQDEMERLYLRQIDDRFPEVYGEPLADLIPALLKPPIVLVERFDDEESEQRVESLVGSYGGRWAGT